MASRSPATDWLSSARKRAIRRGRRVSVVSSADVFEFDGAGQVTTITSYAVELDA